MWSRVSRACGTAAAYPAAALPDLPRLPRSSRPTTSAASTASEIDGDTAEAIGRGARARARPTSPASRRASCASASAATCACPRRSSPRATATGWSPRARTCVDAGHGRHRDALLARRLARPRRRPDVHRLAQPEGLHGREDGRARRASRCPATAACSEIRALHRGRARRGARRRLLRGGRHLRRPSSARALEFIDPAAIKPLKVVLDGGNGMAGPMVGPILEHARRSSSSSTYWVARRRVPRPRAQPAAAREPRVHHRARSARTGADLGIAWDGDADRCFFIDDDGEFVAGDFLTALLAASVLEKTPGRRHPLRRPRLARRRRTPSSRLGGRALVNRVGHAFFKTRMRDEGGEFGGEVSGHYYFKATSTTPTPARSRRC